MSNKVREQEEQNTQRRARLLSIRYFDGRTLTDIPTFEGVFTNEEMYHNHAVVLTQGEGTMNFAITTKTPQPALSQLRKRFQDYQIGFVMISESTFEAFMQIYDPPKEVVYEDVDIKPEEADKSIAEVSSTIEEVRADDVFNYLIRQAHRLQSSDIHLETQEEHVRIRFRVDGVLHEIADFSYEKYRQLGSTIAVEANISSGSPSPQTGHMNHKITADDGSQLAEVNMRVETVPTLYGQDVVIRLFQMERSLLKLDRLGLNTKESSVIDDIVSHPNGLVLSVGPTGSGKTTTLYSILNKLNTKERKIITLEDPVEYSMPGVVQIPVDTNQHKSFASTLSSVLRLDPDVIMIGEIRDADTAKTALQASLSGHLVLSTFHASDTATALSRITEFIGDNPLFASAIRLIIAQRLVRTLDDTTKQETDIPQHLKDRLAAEINTLPEGVERPDIDQLKFYKPGVSDDAPFGYVGQTAVVEMMTLTTEIEKMLHHIHDDVSASDIRAKAQEQGMVTLLQNAILKVADGKTTAEEVFRVIG